MDGATFEFFVRRLVNRWRYLRNFCGNSPHTTVGSIRDCWQIGSQQCAKNNAPHYDFILFSFVIEYNYTAIKYIARSIILRYPYKIYRRDFFYKYI